MCHWQVYTHPICGHYLDPPTFIRCPEAKASVAAVTTTTNRLNKNCGDVSTSYDKPNRMVDFASGDQPCVDMSCVYREKGPVWLFCRDGLETMNMREVMCWGCGHAVCWGCRKEED